MVTIKAKVRFHTAPNWRELSLGGTFALFVCSSKKIPPSVGSVSGFFEAPTGSPSAPYIMLSGAGAGSARASAAALSAEENPGFASAAGSARRRATAGTMPSIAMPYIAGAAASNPAFPAPAILPASNPSPASPAAPPRPSHPAPPTPRNLPAASWLLSCLCARRPYPPLRARSRSIRPFRRPSVCV